MTTETKIYGHSDDCIEVEGAITEEFYLDGDGWNYLVFSDGTIVKVAYCPDGADGWVAHPGIVTGEVAWVKHCGEDEDVARSLAALVKEHPDRLTKAQALLDKLGEWEGFEEWLEDFGAVCRIELLTDLADTLAAPGPLSDTEANADA